MRKLALSIVLALFVFISAFPQSPCLPEGIIFNTQAQIDSFQINYPGCTEIEGGVTIGGNNITNINSLDVLTCIGGSLIIKGTSLTNVIGLNNLISIGENLHLGMGSEGGGIFGNPNLQNLTGLNKLNSIGGRLNIKNNDSLISLTGLDSLTSVSGLHIYGNDLLSSLTGLESLTSIEGSVNIGRTHAWNGIYNGNPSLTSFAALSNLNHIEGDFVIYGNPLNTLSGLDGLATIGGDFMISADSIINLTGLGNLDSIGGGIYIGVLGGNASLITLDGIENLTSIGGCLQIQGNHSLYNITGLNSIDAGSIEYLRIKTNTSLSNCHIQSICEYLSTPNGTIYIQENAPGCNSIEEVEEACETIGIVENDLQSFTIHPNPTDNGSITITLNNPQNNLHLTCFNTYGQQIHTQESQATESVINVSTWQPGIYLAVVYAEGKPVGMAKFVVQ